MAYNLPGSPIDRQNILNSNRAHFKESYLRPLLSVKNNSNGKKQTSTIR